MRTLLMRSITSPFPILGSIYERFLGNTIVTTEKRAEVEPKPEVRKAGGVYYTPEYIVRFIVSNTIGKLIADKTPEQILAMKFADIACGSGSFLLGVFDVLLRRLSAFYNESRKNRTQGKKAGCVEGPDHKLHLSLGQKREILVSTIFGIDIDTQAVEVAQLSLYLKLLEEETPGSVRHYQLEFGEKLLPDLRHNIVCGNSLIEWDILGSSLFENQLDPTKEKELKPRNFDEMFPNVMARGGFDGVVGNPPYVRIQTTDPETLGYLERKYESAVGNFDMYCLFLERALKVSNGHGHVGFILPHRFFKTDYGEGLRKFLAGKNVVDTIVDFDGYMVFDNASINTCILTLEKQRSTSKSFLAQMKFTRKAQYDVADILQSLGGAASSGDLKAGPMPNAALTEKPWVFIWDDEVELWKKLNRAAKRLSDLTTHIFQGFKTGSDPIYIGTLVSESDKKVTLRFGDDADVSIEVGVTKKLIKGGEMRRYLIGESTRRIIFPYVDGELIKARDFRKQYPLAWEHLLSRRAALEAREGGVMSGDDWYGYTRNQALTTMANAKIITPDYYAHASYCLDETGEYSFCGGGAGGYGVVLKDPDDLKWVLGLLNSNVLDWYLKKVSLRAYQTAFMYVKKYIEQLPIPVIPKAQRSQLTSLVDQLLSTKVHLVTSQREADREHFQHKSAALERQINALVYQIFNLTQNEMAIVEGM